uniref:Uncharacterized protein n=1 Tax=Timema cristinae TaxID=61476 RepID=A0A7R9GSG0_TIMCR|nr:unnamed protein product [Timema cristinae]
MSHSGTASRDILEPAIVVEPRQEHQATSQAIQAKATPFPTVLARGPPGDKVGPGTKVKVWTSLFVILDFSGNRTMEGNIPAHTKEFCLIIHDRVFRYNPSSSDVSKMAPYIITGDLFLHKMLIDVQEYLSVEGIFLYKEVAIKYLDHPDEANYSFLSSFKIDYIASWNKRNVDWGQINYITRAMLLSFPPPIIVFSARYFSSYMRYITILPFYMRILCSEGQVDLFAGNGDSLEESYCMQLSGVLYKALWVAQGLSPLYYPLQTPPDVPPSSPRTSLAPLIPQSSEKVTTYLLDKEGDREDKERSQDTATHALSMASNIQQPCVILTHKLADLEFHQPGRSIGPTVLARQQDASYMSYMLLSTGWQPNTLDFQGNVQACSRKKPSSCDVSTLDKDWQRDLNIGKKHSLRRSTSVELEAVSSDLDSLLVKYETMFDSRNNPNSWTTPKPPVHTDASIAPPLALPRIPTTIRDRQMRRLPSSSPNTRHRNSMATDRSESDHCRLQATKL